MSGTETPNPGTASDADLVRAAEDAVRTAARAPSAHNTQPWAPVIEPDGCVLLGVAPGRTLPAGDPTGRDTLLALGAWIEAYSIRMRELGHAIEVEPLPAIADPDVVVRAVKRDAVARIRVVAGVDDAGSSAGSAGATAAGEAGSRRTRPGHASGSSDSAGETAAGARDAIAPDAASGPASATGPSAPGRRPFSSRDLADRLTYRGELEPLGGFAEAAREALPSWMRLAPLEAPDRVHFSALGTADTLRHEEIARELLQWLRLSPAHPRFHVDGLDYRVLGIPEAAAVALAPLTRRRRLRDRCVRAAAPLLDVWRRVLLEVPVRPGEHPDVVTDFALVVEAGELELGEGVELTRVLNSPLGLPPELVLDAGRALLRLWLAASRMGAAFAPRSEVLDSSLAHGELRYRLGLARRDTVVFVASVGIPRVAEPPRSPRRAV